ncbi:MAG: hypothetical protein AABZ06_14250, partial [Bdellovibrionota bacterium]
QLPPKPTFRQAQLRNNALHREGGQCRRYYFHTGKDSVPPLMYFFGNQLCIEPHLQKLEGLKR